MNMIARIALFAANGKHLTWTRRCRKDSAEAPARLDFQVEDNEKFGLVCTRNQFKAWTGWGGDHDARKGLAILVQLGLVDVVDPGMRARNPRHSRPPRYALTTSPYREVQRTNRWRSPECIAIAESLSQAKREVQRRGVTRKPAAHDNVVRQTHARVSAKPSSGAYAPMSFEDALASMRQRRVLQ